MASLKADPGRWTTLGKRTVCTDPSPEDEGREAPDLILLACSDPGRIDSRSVVRLAGPRTIVIGHPSCVSRFRSNLVAVLPGQQRRVLGIEIAVDEDGPGRLRYRIG